MDTDKPLFAQLMDFLAWTTIACYVPRLGDDTGIRAFNYADHFRGMAFVQLTYRESLRDIQVCLSDKHAELYHMSCREPIRRSTRAGANNSPDQPVQAEFAQLLMGQARALYASEDL